MGFGMDPSMMAMMSMMRPPMMPEMQLPPQPAPAPSASAPQPIVITESAPQQQQQPAKSYDQGHLALLFDLLARPIKPETH